MGLYDNAWPHVYEEIKRFYPVWYRDVLEMDAIWRAQGVELDGVRAAVESLINNSYIMTADLQTITCLEDFLRISSGAAQTLDERRQVILAFIRGQGHIGAPEIRNIVSAFTSGAISVGFSLGTVCVAVTHAAEEPFNQKVCGMILLARIPAHLRLRMSEIIHARETASLHVGGAMGMITRIPISAL